MTFPSSAHGTTVDVLTAAKPGAPGLEASLVRGIAWTGSMRWLSQLLSWGSTIAVARILTPGDYGIVGMAVLYLELVTVVNELGLSAAVITKHRLTHHQIAQLNSLCVLLGVAAFLVSCAAAVPLALFFGVPELRSVVLVVSLSCIVTALRAVPSALLQRELQFKAVAIIEGIQAVAAAGAMLLLAIAGFGYWALVFGGLFGKVLWTAMVLSRRTHGFARPRFESLRDALTFSSHVLMSRLSWYAQSNADYLVVGRLFGKELLGVYTLSFTIANMPMAKITALVGRVTFPFFSAIQDDLVVMRRYFLSLTKGLALLTFPLAWGLALVADDLVLGVLGAKWHAAIVPLRCLSFLILIQSIAAMLPHVLNVTGESRFAMRVGIATGLLLPVAFLVGSSWGLAGVALVWVTVYPLMTLPLYWRTFHKLHLSLPEYLRILWPAVSASVMMAAGVWVIRQALPHDWQPVVRLGLQVGGGGLVYVLVVTALYSDDLHVFRRAVALVRGAAS